MADIRFRWPVTVSRDELYAQVGDKPMNRLAAEYGISGNGLANICRRLGGPLFRQQPPAPAAQIQSPPRLRPGYGLDTADDGSGKPQIWHECCAYFAVVACPILAGQISHVGEHRAHLNVALQAPQVAPPKAAGFTSSARSGSPHRARITFRTASRSCTSEAKSVPYGLIASSIWMLRGVHRGNH